MCTISSATGSWPTFPYSQMAFSQPPFMRNGHDDAHLATKYRFQTERKADKPCYPNEY
ncbi:hypothetical protein [Chitinophaga sp.]|uniref:hypothetical protein n=1 Tax=Chitinophaga sp. TaxID=1869181 RepID=UPI0031D22FD0